MRRCVDRGARPRKCAFSKDELIFWDLAHTEGAVSSGPLSRQKIYLFVNEEMPRSSYTPPHKAHFHKAGQNFGSQASLNLAPMEGTASSGPPSSSKTHIRVKRGDVRIPKCTPKKGAISQGVRKFLGKLGFNANRGCALVGPSCTPKTIYG